MPTTCTTKSAQEKDPILQGDIFQNVSYIYKTEEKATFIDITEFTFPYVIVLSQSCDIYAMSKIIEEGKGKTLKFMPSVLLAPIFNKEALKNGAILDELKEKVGFILEEEDLFASKIYNVIKNDQYLRLHALVLDKPNLLHFKEPMIDFKQYFTVSPEYLYSIKKDRICHLDALFCEMITLRFSSYLSRVAIP